MKSIYFMLIASLIFAFSCTRESDLQPSVNDISKTDHESPLAHASQKSVKRPFSDFLDAQGSTSSFLLPVPDFFGWVTGLEDGTLRLLAMDYLGVANKTIVDLGGSDLGTKVTGTVTERPLPDGRARVSVLLHVRDALIWLTDFDDTGDPSTDPLIMGARPQDVADGAIPALGSGSLQFDFINTAPGAPIPDVMLAIFEEIEVEGFEPLQVKITASGGGILHTVPLHELPWEEGDYGKMSLSFHQILFNSPSSNSKLAKNFGFVGSDLKVNKVAKSN